MTTWEQRQDVLRAIGTLHVHLRYAVNAIQEGKQIPESIFTALEDADDALATYRAQVHSE